MARKVKTLDLDESFGRDAGKRFILTEMSAARAARWATRVLMAMIRADVDIPADMSGAGIEVLAGVSLKALGGMSFEEAEPLLNELMTCVEYVPDIARPMVKRPVIDDDIEEVMTLFWLKREVLDLHVNFSTAAGPSISETAAQPTPISLAS